jgi:hypothetical protein
MFRKLIVTAPNGGATVALRDGNKDVACIDSYNATGLAIEGDFLARALQPRCIAICNLHTGAHTFVNGGEGARLRFGDVHDVMIEAAHVLFVSTETNSIDCVNSEGELQWSVSYPGEADSYHFNSIVRFHGKLLASRFGDFRVEGEYRYKTHGEGSVQIVGDIRSVIRGLSQPHSLVAHDGNLILANSAQFEIHEYGEDFGLKRVKKLDGYTRGIAIRNGIVYVGISQDRKDITVKRKAVIVALDYHSWAEIGRYELYGIGEIYSIVGFDDDRRFESAVAAISNASNDLARSGASR